MALDAPMQPSATAAMNARDDDSTATTSQRPPWIRRRPVRLVIYACLASVLLLLLAWPFVTRWLDPTFEKHLARKDVIVGMNRQQVLEAWGSPYTINVSYTKDGVRREEWIYEEWKSAAIKDVKHRYLYFEEGVLVGGWYYK